jgi:hypothetical protein
MTRPAQRRRRPENEPSAKGEGRPSGALAGVTGTGLWLPEMVRDLEGSIQVDDLLLLSGDVHAGS